MLTKEQDPRIPLCVDGGLSTALSPVRNHLEFARGSSCSSTRSPLAFFCYYLSLFLSRLHKSAPKTFRGGTEPRRRSFFPPPPTTTPALLKPTPARRSQRGCESEQKTIRKQSNGTPEIALISPPFRSGGGGPSVGTAGAGSPARGGFGVCASCAVPFRVLISRRGFGFACERVPRNQRVVFGVDFESCRLAPSSDLSLSAAP